MNRTGRTTRMLKIAMRYAHDMHHIIVVAKDNAQIKNMIGMVKDIEKEMDWKPGKIKDTTVKYEYGGLLDFRSIHSAMTWDWKTMRFLTIHSNIPIYVDHFPIEEHIEELHKQIDRFQIEAHKWDE